MRVLDFVLVPDRAAARKIRRVLATDRARIGVQVGTLSELRETARDTYLVAAPGNDWDSEFTAKLSAVLDAFWSKSLEIAPDRTSQAVDRAYRSLLEASPPGAVFPREVAGLGSRASRHLRDLCRLHEALAGALPSDLAVISTLVAAAADHALCGIRVHRIPGQPRLGPWWSALLKRLDHDAGDKESGDLDEALRGALLVPPAAGAGTALGALKRGLFVPGTARAGVDDTVELLLVRDPLEELEVAAGIVCRLLDEDPGLAPSDFAILLPSESDYGAFALEAFGAAGIPLAGLNYDLGVRDLGGEVIHHFLHCRKAPAPRMALAGFLTSPLLPWSQATGEWYARQVMDGRFPPDLDEGRPEAERVVIGLLTAPEGGVRDLVEATRTLCGLLTDARQLARHARRARELLRVLEGVLSSEIQEDAAEAPWPLLLRAIRPEPRGGEVELPATREGAAVFGEWEEPWREVRHLIVCGFTEGRYPAAPPSSPVFSAEDIETLRIEAGLDLEGFEEIMARRRQLFCRQIGAATEGVTLLISRRDQAGNRLEPSSSLVFMERLFAEKALGPLDLALQRDRGESTRVLLAPVAAPEPPRELVRDDLDLGLDLLTVRRRADGAPNPESATALTDLIVSPLAWLLKAADLVPRPWRPEEPDPATLGAVIHGVFELLFPSGGTLPDEDRLLASLPGALAGVIRRKAPFLALPEHRLERRSLRRGLREAIRGWRRILVATEAEVVGTEVRLEGCFEEIRAKGFADVILGLPNGRLFVVDYKSGGADKHRTRMKEGWDLQLPVYRRLLRGGGPTREEDAELVAMARAAPEVGLLYFTTADQVACGLVGTPLDTGHLEDVDAVVDAESLPKLRERREQVRRGEVRLNEEGDEVFFSRRRVPAYALDASPLVRLFTRPSGGGEA